MTPREKMSPREILERGLSRLGKRPAIKPMMTVQEVLAHKADVRRQAIMMYKTAGFFDGAPRRERWKECVSLVVDSWVSMGPQADDVRSEPILMPWKETRHAD